MAGKAAIFTVGASIELGRVGWEKSKQFCEKHNCEEKMIEVGNAIGDIAEAGWEKSKEFCGKHECGKKLKKIGNAIGDFAEGLFRGLNNL